MTLTHHEPTQEILEPGQRTLEELAIVANAENRNCESSLVEAFQHAIICGEALIEAKAKVQTDGSWMQWCSENLEFSTARAQRLIRLATFKDQLPPEATRPWKGRNGRTNMPSLERALVYVSSLPQLKGGPKGKYTPTGPKAPLDDHKAEEIRSLLGKGLKQREIAELVGCSQTTVSSYSDPGRRARVRTEKMRRRRETRRARIALRKQDERRNQDAIARKLGGPLSEAWSLSRKLTQRIDEAHHQTSHPKQKVLLGQAIARVYEAEDALRLVIKQEYEAGGR